MGIIPDELNDPIDDESPKLDVACPSVLEPEHCVVVVIVFVTVDVVLRVVVDVDSDIPDSDNVGLISKLCGIKLVVSTHAIVDTTTSKLVVVVVVVGRTDIKGSGGGVNAHTVEPSASSTCNPSAAPVIRNTVTCSSSGSITAFAVSRGPRSKLSTSTA